MATKTGQRKTEASARRVGKLFGYARVSTTDQDLALQREALERAGANPIFEEKASGTAIARELGMARSSVYRLLEEAGSSRARRGRSERRRAA